MSSYRRHEGFVEVSTNELAANCTRCRDSIIYPKGMTLTWWKQLLRAFVRQHKRCKRK